MKERFRAAAIVATMLALATACFAQQTKPSNKLIVHEWGVLVKAQFTEGTALLAPKEMLDDLPAFAKSDLVKPKAAPLRWRKPVLHFYGPEATACTIKVATAQGRVTAFWPPAQLSTSARQTADGMAQVTEVTGLQWSFTLEAKPSATLNEAPAGHWWNDIRQVPSMYAKTEKADERFLFYEGTALQEPTVQAKVTEDTITLTNSSDQPSGQVLLLLNLSDKHCLKVVADIAAKKSVEIKKADLQAAAVEPKALLTGCQRQWESFGMTPAEGKAITKIWTEDMMEPCTMLLVSRIPSAIYDKMFPLEITPKPAQVVRVGMVFDRLSGQPSRAAWFPGLRRDTDKLCADLGNDSFKVRDAAMRRLARLGDLAKPSLEAATKSKDAQIRVSAESLLKALEPKPFREPPPTNLRLGGTIMSSRQEILQSAQRNL